MPSQLPNQSLLKAGLAVGLCFIHFTAMQGWCPFMCPGSNSYGQERNVWTQTIKVYNITHIWNWLDALYCVMCTKWLFYIPTSDLATAALFRLNLSLLFLLSSWLELFSCLLIWFVFLCLPPHMYHVSMNWVQRSRVVQLTATGGSL